MPNPFRAPIGQLAVVFSVLASGCAGAATRLWDPDGPELFDSLDDAEAARARIAGATGVSGVGEAACTPDDLDAARAHGNI